MSLQAYLCNYLNNCDSVRALVDETNGIRRMDRPSKGTFDRCICIGSIIYGAVSGVERRPMLAMSPAISFWARRELEEMGDLTIQRMFIELMKRLSWVGDNGFPAQDCVGEEPPILVYASEFPGQEIEPNFNEQYQAWTMRVRWRFIVGIPTCLPVADDCSPCIPIPFGDVEGDGGPGSEDLPEEAIEAGEAFTIVSPGQEALVPERDLYVTHPLINTTIFEANKKPLSIAIAYTGVYGIQDLDSSWFVGIKAITAESDYWHIGGNDEAHRLSAGGNVWHIRPSISLADRMADYVITNLNPYFEGVFVDNCRIVIPNGYIIDYRTADEWVEAKLPAVQAAWTAMQAQYVFRLKQAFGAGRCVVPNSGGDARAEADGIWIERVHIDANGVAWAMARFEEQKAFWEDNADRYVHPNPEIASVLNVALGPTLDPVFSIPGLVWPGTTT